MEQNLTRACMNIKCQSRFKLIASEADSYVITACGNKIVHRSQFPKRTHKFKLRIFSPRIIPFHPTIPA